MEISQIKTTKDLMRYIVEMTNNYDAMVVVTALGVASAMTYILFYTDTPEALAASIGDLPGQVLGGGGGEGLLTAAAGVLGR